MFRRQKHIWVVLVLTILSSFELNVESFAPRNPSVFNFGVKFHSVRHPTKDSDPKWVTHSVQHVRTKIMVSYDDLMESLPSKRVVEAVESQQQRGSSSGVIAADVAAAAGVSLSEARKDLTALASISRGDIAVDKDGELIYTFPENLANVLSQNSIKYKALRTFRKTWPLLFWFIRISFGVTLVASLVAIFSAIFFISSSSSSDDRDDRRGGGCGGGGLRMGGFYDPFWGPSPFDFFYYRPYGYYGYYGQPSEERAVRDPRDMGFLESVFSFVFGDGNPNAELEERRLALAANMIRKNGGSVTAEQLAPFCDDAPKPESMTGQSYVDESFVLPIVTALNGEPQVTDDGDIVYTFPELQMSASAGGLVESPVITSEAMTLRRAGLNAKAPNRDIVRLLGYVGVDARGVVERRELIKILEESLAPMTEEEEAELLYSDPSVLMERQWKFSLASDVNKFFAGGLGVVNLGGAIYLGTLLTQYASLGVRLPGYFGTIQAFYPLLLGYAILFNVIPIARNFWIGQQNEKIRKRNEVRNDWKLALANALRDSPVQKKIEAAKKMGYEVKQIGASPDDIVFDTSQTFEENTARKSQQELDDFDKLLGEK